MASGLGFLWNPTEQYPGYKSRHLGSSLGQPFLLWETLPFSGPQSQWVGSAIFSTCQPQGPTLTNVVLYQLLHRLELGPRGDVVATCVQLADLVMLHVIASGLVPIPNGQGVGACGEESPLCLLSSLSPVWKPGEAQKAEDTELDGCIP